MMMAPARALAMPSATMASTVSGMPGLQRAAPGTVQRRLNPDLAHRAGFLF
jgi:hypothetical protein